jgi:hypothetical protein
MQARASGDKLLPIQRLLTIVIVEIALPAVVPGARSDHSN